MVIIESAQNELQMQIAEITLLSNHFAYFFFVSNACHRLIDLEDATSRYRTRVVVI